MLRPVWPADPQEGPFPEVLQTIRHLLIRSGCFRLERELPAWVFTRESSAPCQGTHNNLAERLLRGIAVTRKNFLFLGSDSGGDRAAILYTIIESAKLNDLDPEGYLASVLDRLARGHLNNRLEELLPWTFMPSLALAA